MLYHYFNDGKMERSEGSSITEGQYEGKWVWHNSPKMLGFLTQLVRSSHVIIDIFMNVGGSGAGKKAGSREKISNVAVSLCALLQSAS